MKYRNSGIFKIMSILAITATLLCTTAALAADKKTAPGKIETSVIRWARGNSGNILVTVANAKGYFKEEGLTIKETPIDATAEAFTALTANQVDVLSNYGTNMPLQYIASGVDITIFGGHMLTGCMPIIAKKGVKWHGIKDLIGTTVAAPATTYALTGPLLDAGHDPLKEVKWLALPTQSDRVAAVVAGEAKYGVIGTGMMYSLLHMPDVQILSYLSEVMPNYSCCRMETRTSFIKDNPNTIRALLRALLRAQCYYETHKRECVGLLAKELGTNSDYVAAYMLNNHYRVNVDPIKNSVKKAWTYLDKTGFLDKNAKKIDLGKHINTALYEAALNDCATKYRSEGPAFYDRMLRFYKKNNTGK